MNRIQKRQVAELRVKGESYTKIADALGISVNTVKTHCQRHSLGMGFKAGDICETCKKPIINKPGVKKKRFCSDKCRMAWWNSHPEAVNRKAYYKQTCQTCGTEFQSYGNDRRKFCSRACFGLSRRSASRRTAVYQNIVFSSEMTCYVGRKE